MTDAGNDSGDRAQEPRCAVCGQPIKSWIRVEGAMLYQHVIPGDGSHNATGAVPPAPSDDAPNIAEHFPPTHDLDWERSRQWYAVRAALDTTEATDDPA